MDNIAKELKEKYPAGATTDKPSGEKKKHADSSNKKTKQE